jgi:hypothetical protein
MHVEGDPLLQAASQLHFTAFKVSLAVVVARLCSGWRVPNEKKRISIIYYIYTITSLQQIHSKYQQCLLFCYEFVKLLDYQP